MILCFVIFKYSQLIRLFNYSSASSRLPYLFMLPHAQPVSIPNHLIIVIIINLIYYIFINEVEYNTYRIY